MLKPAQPATKKVSPAVRSTLKLIGTARADHVAAERFPTPEGGFVSTGSDHGGFVAHHFGTATYTIAGVAEQPADEQKDEPTSSKQLPTQGSGWLAPLALIVALAAVGLAVWGLVRPPASQAQHPSEAAEASAEQIASSKAEACDAFETVRSSVSLQTHATGDGPAGVQAVAANARLSMLGGATYLLSRTGPSTSTDLADAIDKFANGLQDIAMHSLTGIGNDNPRQADRLRDADAANKVIADLCAQP